MFAALPSERIEWVLGVITIFYYQTEDDESMI
jgi:hypothetical protein